MDLPNILTLTVAGAVSLLLGGGINFAVAYALQLWTNGPERVKTVLQYIGVVLLTGLVTYVAGKIPQGVLDGTVVQGVAGGIGLLVNYVGGEIGKLKATDQVLSLAVKAQQLNLSAEQVGTAFHSKGLTKALTKFDK